LLSCSSWLISRCECRWKRSATPCQVQLRRRQQFVREDCPVLLR